MLRQGRLILGGRWVLDTSFLLVRGMWNRRHRRGRLHLPIVIISALWGQQYVLLLLILMSLYYTWIYGSNLLLPIENRVHKLRMIVKHRKALLWVIQDSWDVLIDLIPQHYVWVQLVHISTVILISLGLPSRIAFHLVVLSACSWPLLLYSGTLQGHGVVFEGSLGLN